MKYSDRCIQVISRHNLYLGVTHSQGNRTYLRRNQSLSVHIRSSARNAEFLGFNHEDWARYCCVVVKNYLEEIFPLYGHHLFTFDLERVYWVEHRRQWRATRYQSVKINEGYNDRSFRNIRVK